MPPKSAPKHLIIKAKRQASVYFITVLPNDTFGTLKAQIAEIVNHSGGLIIDDALNPISEADEIPEIPTIGANLDSSSDEEDAKEADDGYETDDTAPMIAPARKQISIDDIDIALYPSLTELQEDNMKIQDFDESIDDFAEVVFKMKNEESFNVYSKAYGI